MATFSIASKSRTFSTLQALNTALADVALAEGDSYRLTWTTDTGGKESVTGIISGGKLDPH